MLLLFIILPLTASLPQRQRQLTAETCEVTDFEEKTRQECEEVKETECQPVKVTKFKTELVRKCKTFTDQRCNVTYTEVPRQACRATKEQVCHIEFALVEEVRYADEVCDTSVQNFCEDPVEPLPPQDLPPSKRPRREQKYYEVISQHPAEAVGNGLLPPVKISKAALSLFFPRHHYQPLSRQARQASAGGPPPVPPPPPARVTVTELAAPPGCRSLATTECRSLPRVTTVKVPQEKCHLEPSVVCDTVLKRVPELTCVPEVMEECNIFPKETPFLVDEEECEEVVYDECVEVSEKIPVEVRREISLIQIVFLSKFLLLSVLTAFVRFVREPSSMRLRSPLKEDQL